MSLRSKTAEEAKKVARGIALTGLDGERGQQGDTGQRGVVGPQGARGRGLSLWQAFAAWLLILIIGLVGGWNLERQQDEIEVNAARIADTQRLSCQNGLRILEGFNAQQDALAAVEQELLTNPDASPAGRKAAAARIKAYQSGKIDPLPVCAGR